MERINILIADDHPLVRSGLRSVLEGQKNFSVSEAENGEEALARIETEKPTLVLLDISMPKKGGMEIAPVILRKFPQVKVVILTMHDDEGYIAKMIEAGVHGYMLKDSGNDEIIKGIRRIVAGERYFSEGVFGVIAKIKNRPAIRTGSNDEALNRLTAREKQILILIAEGLSTPEIAKKLFLSPRTVDTHRANIMHKLHIHQATGLVRFAIENKLLPSVSAK